MPLLSGCATFDVYTDHFQQTPPALAHVRYGERCFELPRSDNSIGKKEHNQHIDRAVDKTGALSQVAPQSEVEQAEDRCACQRAVECAHATDQDHQQGGDGETQPGDVGTDDRLIDGVQCASYHRRDRRQDQRRKFEQERVIPQHLRASFVLADRFAYPPQGRIDESAVDQVEHDQYRERHKIQTETFRR